MREEVERRRMTEAVDTSWPMVLVVYGAFLLLHRCMGALSCRFQVYRDLPSDYKVDWETRGVNMLFQVAQAGFNIHVMFFDIDVAEDYMLSYSQFFHRGAILTAGFYVYDAAVLALNPRASLRYMWILHHFLCVGLLGFNFSYRTGAFPSACFLISAAAHIPNELRWFAYKSDSKNRLLLNSLHLSCAMAVLFSNIVPPLYMLRVLTKQQETTLAHLLTKVMKLPCQFGFIVIYVPHCILFFAQIQKAWNGWNILTFDAPQGVKAKKLS
eukprot:Plantae.Rhodophyta-Purpureofilum_apyrenoidigerum.ctg1121.p1 GENE.Plantae.Rhodophyta-Purpureofilum_apyrenoidigerum.ctg1121~~Plantae.Rhodophyta-Purpureofilum_apyrenoidigerum.ctg1121.p1  ORF type:complete len:269 (+),score=29.60 Plantae.Rhodophyta-Purpureofilum_apyrenoidigerum.ctg1121:116-922(+)